MSQITTALGRAYSTDPDYSELLDMIEARSGVRPSIEWLEAMLGEVMAHIRVHAPCRRQEWLTPGDLPDDTAAVLLAVLKRALDNPTGVRTEQMGEYSVTYAGQIPTTGSPLTDVEARIIRADAACPGNRQVPIGGLPSVGSTVPAEPSSTVWDAGLGL